MGRPQRLWRSMEWQKWRLYKRKWETEMEEWVNKRSKNNNVQWYQLVRRNRLRKSYLVICCGRDTHERQSTLLDRDWFVLFFVPYTPQQFCTGQHSQREWRCSDLISLLLLWLSERRKTRRKVVVVVALLLCYPCNHDGRCCFKFRYSDCEWLNGEDKI